jgi:hypothetical protein
MLNNEVGGQVHTDARFCPHCGQRKPEKGMSWRVVAVSVLFGIALLGGRFSPTLSRSATRSDSSVPGPVAASPHATRVALSDLKIDRSWANEGMGPEPVASHGYLNRTPLTAHTSSAFDSTGATALVAFVGTHPAWLSRTVAIKSFTDSVGNTWIPLAGPTVFNGASFEMMGAVFYCNSPVTSATHTVTVTLSNPAPLVVQTFAVSGTDGTTTPLVSAIGNPGVGHTSATVASPSISVPAHTLLLAWVKTEDGAAVTPGAGWYGDSSATSHLTPAHKSNVAATSYASSFILSSPNGWQTAIVGLTPAH